MVPAPMIRIAELIAWVGVGTILVNVAVIFVQWAH